MKLQAKITLASDSIPTWNCIGRPKETETLHQHAANAMKKPKDVDSYIAAAPEEVRAKLTELRRVIKKAAPRASERISYGMPFYEYGGTGYKGRLVYFAAFKKHISLFIIPRHAGTVTAELANYHASKATYRFDLDKPIPFRLIGRTVKALVRERDTANKTSQ